MRAKRPSERLVGDNVTEKLFALLYNQPPIAEDQVVRRLTGGKASKTVWRYYAQLRHEGWLTRTPEGRIGLETREGILRVNPRGFGFVVNPEFPGEDVFVPERWLMGASHEDRVLVWVRRMPDAPGPEGRIMDVLARSTDHVVGRLERARAGGWRVVPRDPRRPIVSLGRLPKGRLRAGDLVTTRITEWPLDPKRPVRGELLEVLGGPRESGIDVAILAAEHHLSQSFPDAVVKEAQALPPEVQQQDLVGRLDLREKFIVTIDGRDAKDLDDAISLDIVEDGYEIGVHIADVSFYVAENSALDLEARRRGTSIYLVDRVIPMLPERLSNGIASLNPGVDRLTVSAFIRIDRQGQILGSRFARSVIRSRYRLTYEGVNALWEKAAPDEHDLLPWITDALAVRGLLRRERMRRGAVDFDLPEAKVVLDARGRPVDVVLRNRGLAESLIEEFMLAANEAVAKELLRHRLPGLFRVHDQPGSDKIIKFRELIGALGYRLPLKVTPKALQDLLEKVKGRPEERVVSSALLRSMKQARYGPENTGHFGLASKEYTHFTSPIRRYPDLWVHRVLTRHLEGTLDADTRARWLRMAPEIGEIASTREREAMDAERDSVALKEAEFMAQHLGEVYQAVVSGVTSFGVFVELPNLIEGLVRVDDLPADAWVFDPVHLRLSGRRTGREFRLGQEVSVMVARVDIGLRRIDFTLVEPSTPISHGPRRRPRRKNS